DAVTLPCANRADKAGWPAPAHHRLPALILCSVKNRKPGLSKPLLKLHLVARHRSNPQKQPYVPVLYHALMAEDSAQSGRFLCGRSRARARAANPIFSKVMTGTITLPDAAVARSQRS